MYKRQLYYTKIKKFGMLTITGIIGGIFFYLIGYGLSLIHIFTEELKARDPMRWVGLMNTLKAQAEEVIQSELIFQ